MLPEAAHLAPAEDW